MKRALAKMILLAVSFLFFTASGRCQAQSAQKIVDEYVRAEGGSKALARIQNATITGSVTDDSGHTGSYSLITKAPNKFYSEIIVGPHRLIEAFNGKSAWGQDSADESPAAASALPTAIPLSAPGAALLSAPLTVPHTAPHTMTGAVAMEWEAAGRYLNSRMADVKKSKIVMRPIDIQDVDGRKAYHVEALLAPHVRREIYFDAQSHWIVREIVPAPPRAPADSIRASGEQIDYGDYRAVDGIAAPYRITIRRGGRTYTIAVSRITWNGPVNDSVFDFPANDNRPLPEVKSLLFEVAKNQRAIEELQKQYTCHLVEEEEKIDSKGETTSRTVKEYDVFNCGGEEVRRLVKDDSKPLSAEQLQKEDERFNKEFKDRQKKEAELAGDPKKQEKEDQREQASISDFLRVESFTNPRRERFRGEDVIVFDFGPNPDYKPRKLAESIAQKLVGVVWIDEQARDVARLEARFSDTVKIGGGLLASLDRGTSLVLEQTRVNGEVWLPSYSEVHAAARLVFLKVKQNEIDRYSDYKKFRVETRIGPSTPVPDPSPQPNAETTPKP